MFTITSISFVNTTFLVAFGFGYKENNKFTNWLFKYFSDFAQRVVIFHPAVYITNYFAAEK